MVGFFYVRKLIESRKLSREFADRQVKATSYPAKGTHIHFMNFHRDVNELFDLNSPKSIRIKIEDLANQVIHSYMSYLSISENGFAGILVASDRTRNKELFEISKRT